MQLLYTTRSPFARKIRIMAIEKGIALDLLEEDLFAKSPALFAANPLGKVPALILDNQETLFDSPVICEYIDSLNNHPIFIPAAQRFAILRWQALADGLVENVVGMYLEKLRHPNDFNEPFIQTQEANCALILNYCEHAVKQLNDLSLASISVACAVDYLSFRTPHLNQTGMYPLLQAWLAAFSTRDSLQKTKIISI